MQIKRILQLSFFILLFIEALALTALAFFSSRAILQEEIGRNLTSDAAMLMEEVDMLMFERLQNIHSWSRQEIIQEARIADVDKRLSQFLTDTEVGYQGVYRSLFYVDAQNQVIAASTPDLIGQYRRTATNWITAKAPNGEIVIEAPQFAFPYESADLVMRAAVLDRYSTTQIGQFYGLFNVRQLFHLLDKSSNSEVGERYVVLLDAEGRTLATSLQLRNLGYLLKNDFANWKPPADENLFVHDGEPITTSNLLVGYAKSKGYQGYAQLGWSILIFQSTEKAFLPIHTYWLVFSSVVFATILLAFLVSHWLSGRIAKPLSQLTQWVRGVSHFEKPIPPNVDGTIEIREMESAFCDLLLELERSREHVIQTAKLAVVGEMAAIMAHEVRTPLGILSTSAQWLQREPELSPEGKEMTQFILDESARLKRLVTTLLECARPRAPQMHAHNLHDIITHVVEILAIPANQKALRIDQQLTALNPILVCDHELLTQVFLNLLHNAIQIVPDNGWIKITTASYLEHIAIEIADDGPGIADEDYQRLFDPFFTKREQGVGLGLTVTKQIISAHQGTITAAPSHQLGGACFTIILPYTGTTT